MEDRSSALATANRTTQTLTTTNLPPRRVKGRDEIKKDSLIYQSPGIQQWKGTYKGPLSQYNRTEVLIIIGEWSFLGCQRTRVEHLLELLKNISHPRLLEYYKVFDSETQLEAVAQLPPKVIINFFCCI